MTKKRSVLCKTWLILSEEGFCFPVITDEHHGAGGQMAETGRREWASAWAPASGLL